MSNPYEIAAEHGADLSGCHSEPGLTICTGTRGVHRRMVRNCPTCERRTPFVETFRGVWYGHIFYCANCLDGWIDGERMERPFYRYWKRDRAKHIRKLWDSAMMPRLYVRPARAGMSPPHGRPPARTPSPPRASGDEPCGTAP